MTKYNVGTKNGMWRGGRSVASNGYMLVRVGYDHPLADVRGYAYEHRVVAESVIGRRLRHGELVHHRNGNRLDNRPENLEVVRGHARHHFHHRKPGSKLRHPDEPNPWRPCECGCGTSIRRFDRGGRPRRFISGHNGRAHR